MVIFQESEAEGRYLREEHPQGALGPVIFIVEKKVENRKAGGTAGRHSAECGMILVTADLLSRGLKKVIGLYGRQPEACGNDEIPLYSGGSHGIR